MPKDATGNTFAADGIGSIMAWDGDGDGTVTGDGEGAGAGTDSSAPSESSSPSSSSWRRFNAAKANSLVAGNVGNLYKYCTKRLP